MVGAHSARERLVKEFVQPFPGAKILDIGCGPGVILDYLPKAIEYTGYDLNPKYIAYAQKKYAGRAQFFCANINKSSEFLLHAGQFDIVLAIGILHHLNDSEANQLFEIAYHHIKGSGALITFDCVYVPNQSKIAKYVISKDRGQYVRTPEEYLKLATKKFSCSETIILSDMLRIPYNHFIMRLTKS